MSKELEKLFKEEFCDLYNPEEALFGKAEQAKDISEILSYLHTVLIINPQNTQAKQKLLEIYPIAIQDVVDDGRYEDALHLVQYALGVENKNKQLLLLKFKILGYRFISKYYPEEERYFDALWEKLKSAANLSLQNNKPLLAGISFTGSSSKNNLDKMASPSVAIIMLEINRILEDKKSDIKSSEIKENINTIMDKHGIAKKLSNEIILYLNDAINNHNI